jgi:hypothetical protein
MPTFLVLRSPNPLVKRVRRVCDRFSIFTIDDWGDEGALTLEKPFTSSDLIAESEL